MTKPEELASLGETLRQDFLILMGKLSRDWLEHDDFSAGELSTLRAVETDVYKIFHASFEFATVEENLTSGFFPADLAVANFGTIMPASEEAPKAAAVFFATPRHQRDNLREDGERNREETATTSSPMPKQVFGPVKGLKDFARILESGAHEASEKIAAPDDRDQPSRSSGERLAAPRLDQANLSELRQNVEAGSNSSDDHQATGQKPGEASDSSLLTRRRAPHDDGEEKIRAFDDHLSAMAGEGLNPLPPLFAEKENGQRFGLPLPDPRAFQRKDQGARVAKKQRRNVRPYAPSEDASAKVQRHSSWNRIPFDDDFLVQASPINGELASGAEAVQNAHAVSPFDLDDLLAALSQEIEREYRRFYGS